MIRSKQEIFLGPGGYLRRAGKRGIIVFRFWHEKKEYPRSTGTTDAALAREKAWQIYQDATGRTPEDRLPVPLRRNTHATAGEVAATYLANIVAWSKISPATARANVNALALIVSEARGFAGEQWMDVRVDELTPELVIQWRRRRYAAKGLDLDRQTDLWLNGTLNSTLTQARCVFSRRAWLLYSHLKMPKRENILYMPKLATPDYTFVAMDPAVDARMQALAKNALEGKPAEPDSPSAGVAVAYELARFCGLTAKEIAAARWDWLEAQPDGSYHLVLKARAGADGPDAAGVAAFTTKLNKKNRRLGVARERVERWRAAQPEAPRVLAIGQGAAAARPGFIVPGVNAEQVNFTVRRRTNAWIRKFLPDGKKALHKLRAQGGSDIREKEGLEAAADWLGDSIATAKRFYISRTVAKAL